VGVVLATILRHYWRERRWSEGALVAALWGLNGELMQLSLQARGYGFLAGFALGSSFLALRYARGQSVAAFMGIGIFTVLGAYTVPTYALFGGPLMALMAGRNRRAWAITAATTGITVLLYAPVAKELFHAASIYKTAYGEFYVGIPAVVETLTTYLWPVTGPLALLLLAILGITPILLLAKDSPVARATAALTGAVILFLGCCLWMRTPPVRTTAFVALPLAICTVESVGGLMRRIRSPRVTQWIRTLCCSAAIAFGVSEITQFQFMPYENWQRVWQFIQTMFPPGSLVDCSRKANGLTFYLDQQRYALNLDPSLTRMAPFAAGAFPIVVAPWKWEPVGFREWNGKGFAVTAPGKIRDVTIYFAPPEQSGVYSMHSKGNNVMLQPSGGGAPLHSLNVAFNRPIRCDHRLPSCRVMRDGREEAIEEEKMIQIGDVLTIPLGDKPASVITLSPLDPGLLRRVWINPCPGKQ
jgi:hypothetical protein